MALSSQFIMAAGRSPAAAVGTDRPPVIDGVIGGAEWNDAARFEEFLQLEPRRGAPASQRTVGYFLYDDQNLYFAVYCHDTEPEKITARLTRRDDRLSQDDAVFLMLDTFHDRRTAYLFATNPLGTQHDGRIKDDGRVVEDSWDAAWLSAARIGDEGWSAEFAIPLRVLMYPTGDQRTWGFNLGRTRRANLESAYWHGPLESGFRISQYGEITGLTLQRGGAKPWEWIPYTQGRWEQGETPAGTIGFDLRYTLRPETAANITVNPDFAIIEADQEFVNLTRYEARLEEKRPFFLESLNRFRQRIQLFYSRRIAEIDVGGQFVSRRGPVNFTLLSALSPNVPDPSAAPNEPAEAGANYTVGRVELDFLRSSNVALMFANRHLNGESRGSIGLDTTMHWTRKLNFTGQLIHAHGPHDRGNWAYFVRPSYDTNTGHFHFRYTHLGDRFGDNANAIGFVPDDNRREMDSDLTKVLWLEKGPVQRIEFESRNNIFWGQDGALRGYHNDLDLEIETRNRWVLAGGFRNEFRLFEKGFHNDRATLEIGYNTREFNSWKIEYQQGRSFDSDFRELAAEFHRKVTTQLSLDYQLSRVWLDPDPESESTWINVLRLQQSFSRDMFLKLFFQTNSVIDRRNIEIVFVWRHKPPFGSLQFAYQRGRAAFGERSEQGNTYFVKLSHVF